MFQNIKNLYSLGTFDRFLDSLLMRKTDFLNAEFLFGFTLHMLVVLKKVIAVYF